MKRLVLALIFVIAVSSRAFAAFDYYMTDKTPGDGTTYTDRSFQVFNLAEVPYLYLHVPGNDWSETVVASWWTNPYGEKFFESKGPKDKDDFFMTLNWDDVGKTAGDWTVTGLFFADDGSSRKGTTGFTFAPEPVSAGLFLLGGGALALIRRKKA